MKIFVEKVVEKVIKVVVFVVERECKCFEKEVVKEVKVFEKKKVVVFVEVNKFCIDKKVFIFEMIVDFFIGFNLIIKI